MSDQLPPFLTSPALARLSHIRHAYFTREGGVSKGPIYSSLNGGIGSDDDPAAVAQNRALMAKTLYVAPSHFLSLYQIHSADALIATAPWEGGTRPQADGLATNTPHLALAVGAADCGPVLFADKERRIIGACHAGWKGAFTGVMEATITKMESLGSKRHDIIATLGPCISAKNYEVGAEFIARFLAQSRENAHYFTPSTRAEHHMFDMQAYIIERLNAYGVEGTGLGLCTYADEQRFYSYRRTTHRKEPDYGRLIAAIALA